MWRVPNESHTSRPSQPGSASRSPMVDGRLYDVLLAHMSQHFSSGVSRAFRLRRSLRKHSKSRGELPQMPDGLTTYVPAIPVGLELKLEPGIQGDEASLAWLADLAGQPGGEELRVQTFTVSVGASGPDRMKVRVLKCPILTDLKSLHWIPPTPSPLAQDVDVVDYLEAWGTSQLQTLWLEPNRNAEGSVRSRHAGHLRSLFGLKLPALKHLALPGLDLSSRRGAHYLQSCEYIAGLHSLDISWSVVNDAGALAAVLKKATGLQILSLSHVVLDAAGLAAIVAATPDLTELDITYTEVEEDAADSLFALVKRGMTLRASHNRIPAALNDELREAAVESGADVHLGYRLPKKST